MGAVFTEFLLIAILSMLAIAKITDDYFLERLDMARSELYGFVFLVIGLIGMLSTPAIFMELDSPLYTGATFVLGVNSALFGWVHSKTGRIKSLESITMITLFTISSYFLTVFIAPIRKLLIETVASHTTYFLAMSYDVKVMEGPVYGYMSQIVFFQTDPTFITYIDIACTGIGSIALVWGIISVFNTGRKKKLAYMISAAIIIYILNLIRNVFIAIAFVEQWFAHPILQKLALASGANGDKLVSFVVAETFISQFLSAILLFIGLFLVVTYTSLLENIFSDFEDDVDFTYSYIKNRFN